MRFMMIMYPGEKAYKGSGVPDAKGVAAMMKYNEALAGAGVLLAMDGLQSPAKGARVHFSSSGKPTVTDGPFAEAKEVVGGYWLISVKSKEEAVEWATRCPEADCTIEVRQMFEFEDFPPDVQEAAAGEPALLARLEQQRRS